MDSWVQSLGGFGEVWKEQNLESLWSRWHPRPWEDRGFSLGTSVFKGVDQGQGLVQVGE